MSGHLVAILHSLPSGEGTQTLKRIELARRTLACATTSVANIFPTKLPGVRAMSAIGAEEIWQLGRSEIDRELGRHATTDVLLGYGVSQPVGALRPQFQEQIAWLHSALDTAGHRVWTFGGRPTHPSRWQRVVFKERPGCTLEQVAAQLLLLRAAPPRSP